VHSIPESFERKCRNAQFSPDGQSIVALCPIDGHVKNQDELQTVSLSGGAWKRMSADVDREFFGVKAWTPDGKAVVGTASDGTASGMWTMPLSGTSRKWNTAKLTITDVDVAPDGSAVIIATSAQRPAELYFVANPQAAPERLSDIHKEVAGLQLGRMESMFWKSDDGLPLSAVVTYPPDFDASKKYPVVLHIHGGPWGSSKETFSNRVQLFASRGWIVFEPNYRGSDNFGNKLYAAVYRDHGAGLGRDVMSGLEELKKKSYVDSSRIGVSGWSYGGYMTTWLIGHYTGWKAAMAGAAVIDLIEDYNLLDLPLFKRAYGDTVSFPKDLELMKEQSPGTYVDQMKTPLLLISDAADVRVPVVQSYKLYNALKERGQDVKMLLYPVAGHVPADPWRNRDIDRKWMEWFEERLK
jgi:dipeptidyl aminopeptidase/acylaminoacyl peptidase